MDRDSEPIRLYGWTALVVGVGLIVGVGLLIDPGAWKVILAGALIAASSQVSGIEWARGTFTRGDGGAWSPAAHRRAVSEAYARGVEQGSDE